MKKNCGKIVGILMILVLATSFFVGCSSEYYLKKHAKKQNKYSLDLTLNAEEMTIAGYEKFEYENRGDGGVESLVFHLYPRAFRDGASIKPYSNLTEAKCFPNGMSFGDLEVREVKVDGNNHEIKLVGEDEDKLEVGLGKNLFMGDRAVVEIWFDLKLPNCTHRFGYFENNINLGNFYPILAVRSNGEYDMTPYYANGDPFFSECASYDVVITAPSEYKVFSSGNVTNASQKGDTTKTCMSALSVRDFAIILGTNLESKSIEGKNFTVNYVGSVGDGDISANAELAHLAAKYFSEKFKAYPYKTLNIVKTPFVHGGMEYPGIVMISDTLTTTEEVRKVIVHEIAHEWWYGIVGVNETKDAWIDEGLAEFSTALFFDDNSQFGISYNQMINDAITSYTLYVDVISALDKSMNTKMNLPVNEYLNEYEYTYMIYVKGLLLFDDLMTITGKDKLIKALAKIAKDYEFKNITTDIFTESIKKGTKKNTDNFFEGYLNGNAIIGKVH